MGNRERWGQNRSYEQLFQIACPRAANGELRANDQCRKLLVELGRLHGLEGVRTATPPPGEDDGGYGDHENTLPSRSDPDDGLAQYRLP